MEFKYKNNSLVDNNKVLSDVQSLDKFTEKLINIKSTVDYSDFESSINLPFDKGLFKNINTLKSIKCTDDLRYILVIGIGGSNLGTKAVYDGLRGHFDKYTPTRFPKILFSDTNDTNEVVKLISFLNTRIRKESEILVNIISKSGKTVETIANGEIIVSALKKQFGDRVMNRIVITTERNSQLWEYAEYQKLSILEIPKKIGGRFSVFSSVGLFPLMCADIDVKSLLKGAQTAENKYLVDDTRKNNAMMSAIAIFHNLKESRSIHNTFIFHPELESLGKWYRQLLSESVGKEKDRNGKKVNVGITPIVSIGSTDLHSMGQLYFGGPDDKITTFVSTKKIDQKISVPKNNFKKIDLPIEGKSLEEISNAIIKGVKTAYKKHGLPFMEIELKNISAESIGEFLQFKMLEIMYLGELLNINVFDQPSVELYKKEIRKNLK